MAKSNDILEKYGLKMATFFTKRLDEIDAEIERLTAPLQREKEEIFDFLAALSIKGNGGNGTATHVHAIYEPENLSMIEKAIFFTRHEGFLTTSEIADRICKGEPNLDKSEVKATLSAVFAMEMKKEPFKVRLIRRENSDGKWAYQAK